MSVSIRAIDSFRLAAEAAGAPRTAVSQAPVSEARSAGEAFAEALVRAGVDAAKAEETAADSVARFARDEDVNIHDVVVDVEKAEVSLKLMVSMRNRLIEAYREVMKMGM